MKTETIEYREGDTVMRGYLAYDETKSGKRPGILVAHDILGLGEDPKRRARMLAELGYVALAIDMYGEGLIPTDFPHGMKLLNALREDQPLLRRRVGAALDKLASLPQTDPKRLGAIGYCFGGAVALELARSGADVAGVVSFHGALATKDTADAKNIKGKVLACHGADDPIVPQTEVAGFVDEMRQSGADWRLIQYGGALHSFTNPGVDRMNNPAAKYNEPADRRSWRDMQEFFHEAFAA